MVMLANVIIFTIAAIANFTLAAEFRFKTQATLQCYICVVKEKENVQDETACEVTGPNVMTAQCAMNHGFDRCMYYRARTKNGDMMLRRQCATAKKCEKKCLHSHHTDCQLECCEGDLCNDRLFGQDWKESGPKVTTEFTGQIVEATLEAKKKVIESGSPTAIDVPDVVINKKTTPSLKETAEQGFAGQPAVPLNTDCQDYKEGCAEYAAYEGYCQYHDEFMIKHCPLSCCFCGGDDRCKGNPLTSTVPSIAATTGTPVTQQATTSEGNGEGIAGGPNVVGGCVDKYAECPVHAALEGYCSYQEGFMIANCPLSCDYCDDLELPESPVRQTSASPPTTEPTQPEPTATSTEAEPEDSTTTPGGCLDLREECSSYALVDGYCVYQMEFMKKFCPFSCGFCGITLETTDNGPFPHPPVVHSQNEQQTKTRFPKPPTKKDVYWLAGRCGECRDGYKRCSSKCIMVSRDGSYDRTSVKNCLKIRGKPMEKVHC